MICYDLSLSIVPSESIHHIVSNRIPVSSSPFSMLGYYYGSTERIIVVRIGIIHREAYTHSHTHTLNAWRTETYPSAQSYSALLSLSLSLSVSLSLCLCLSSRSLSGACSEIARKGNKPYNIYLI